MYEFVVGLKNEQQCLFLFAEVFRRETASVLELALWKARICDGIIFTSVQEMREYEILDPEFNVGEYTKKMRITCGAEVIIPLVMEYLGPVRVSELPSCLYSRTFRH